MFSSHCCCSHCYCCWDHVVVAGGAGGGRLFVVVTVDVAPFPGLVVVFRIVGFVGNKNSNEKLTKTPTTLILTFVNQKTLAVVVVGGGPFDLSETTGSRVCPKSHYSSENRGC